MKPQSSLVWAENRVELDSVASIDLDLALVILPGDSELDDAFGYRDDSERFPILWVLLEQL